jgi:hypothetical protein
MVYDPSSRFLLKNIQAVHALVSQCSGDGFARLVRDCLFAITNGEVRNDVELREFICYEIQASEFGVSVIDLDPEQINPLSEFIELAKEDLENCMGAANSNPGAAESAVHIAHALVVVGEVWAEAVYHRAFGLTVKNKTGELCGKLPIL